MLADEDEPDLLFDFATPTGAARVALGPICRPCSAATTLAQEIAGAGEGCTIPVWRLPLWALYDGLIEGKRRRSSTMFRAVSVRRRHRRRTIPAAFRKASRAAWAHFDDLTGARAPKPGRRRAGRSRSRAWFFELLRHRVEAAEACRASEKRRLIRDRNNPDPLPSMSVALTPQQALDLLNTVALDIVRDRGPKGHRTSPSGNCRC